MGENFKNLEDVEISSKDKLPCGIWLLIVYLLSASIYYAYNFGSIYVMIEIWPYSGIGIARWYSMSFLPICAAFFLFFSRKKLALSFAKIIFAFIQVVSCIKCMNISSVTDYYTGIERLTLTFYQLLPHEFYGKKTWFSYFSPFTNILFISLTITTFIFFIYIFLSKAVNNRYYE